MTQNLIFWILATIIAAAIGTLSRKPDGWNGIAAIMFAAGVFGLGYTLGSGRADQIFPFGLACALMVVFGAIRLARFVDRLMLAEVNSRRDAEDGDRKNRDRAKP